MAGLSEKFSPIWIGVVADGFFQPINAFTIERPSAFEGLRQAECLVVVDHDHDLAAQALPHRMQRTEILLERRITKSELDRTKAAGEEFFRLVGKPFRRHQAEAAGVVGRNALGRAAKQRRERPTGSDRQRIPGCHVKTRHRHAHDALHADEREALAKPAPKVERREGLALYRARHLVEDFADRRHRGWKITPQV
jgi:hypothetical protein